MVKTLRSSKKLLKSLGYCTVLALVACTTGHCRRDGTKVVDKEVARPSGYEAPDKGTVKVAKPDGSKQCGFAPGLTLEKMAEMQLDGIAIVSSEKQKDGLMHSAACGSSTGMMNVYEISRGDLGAAEGKGFVIFKR